MEIDYLTLIPDAMDDGLYCIVENFPEGKGLPVEAIAPYAKGEILGQAVYAKYKTFGRALEGMLKGSYKDGRRVIRWI